MKLFPEATLRFLREGNCHTKQSKEAFRSSLSGLQGMFPGLDLDQFTTVHLTRFCLKPSPGGAAPAPATVKARKTRLSSFFQWAKWQGLIPVDPSADLQFTVRAGSGGVREHAWLSEAEVVQVLDACPDDFQGRRARLVLMFGFLMGLRRSEIAGLRWSQFRPDLSELSLLGKGRKRATLGVPSQVQDCLLCWPRSDETGSDVLLPQLRWSRWQETLQPAWQYPIGKGAVGQIVREAGERVGLHLEPHDMRRSYCRLLTDRGLPLVETSQMMRHESVGTTDKYLKKNPARAVEVAHGLTLNLGGSR